MGSVLWPNAVDEREEKRCIETALGQTAQTLAKKRSFITKWTKRILILYYSAVVAVDLLWWGNNDLAPINKSLTESIKLEFQRFKLISFHKKWTLILNLVFVEF